ncbi:MAG: S46 family peptidase [Prevotellaceae bacterium]|jgi:hypothetical protein|nr:S46 family peptidase [Prevotellaceae bacterium]
MQKIFSNLIILIFLTNFLAAQQSGGMWLPVEVNKQEMSELGKKFPDSIIFNTAIPSLEDAVVQFNGGCTAELISAQGLLLTNHHCGYSQIQAHSTLENDLLTNGFWAKSFADELPNPEVTVDFIVDIQDITPMILAGTRELTVNEAQKVINDNIKKYKIETKIAEYQSLKVVPFYAGNKYYAFTIETFRDIRLVGAPPQSIGKFGADTDNWVFPRHTGDFSLFRIYADKNNRPAAYSPDNVPFKSKYFLPVSIRDLSEGDFTFIYGFPGTTNEYLPAVAVEQVLNALNPARIEMRDATLKILDAQMRTDNATRLRYAAKYAGIANSWKKWIGECAGLKKSNAVNKKRSYEQQLMAKNRTIAKTLDEFAELYEQQAPYALANAYLNELVRNSETLNLANIYLNFLRNYKAGKTNENYISNIKNRLSIFYKNYDKTLDAQVTAKLLSIYAQKIPTEFLPDNFFIYKNEKFNFSEIKNLEKKSIITGDKKFARIAVNQDINAAFNDTKKLAKELGKDPFINLLEKIQNVYYDKVDKNHHDNQLKISTLQKQYMAQQIATDTQRKFFPDANSTLRIAYGQIRGSEPADGVEYAFQTTLDGVIQKYVPDDYEFDVPEKLMKLYKSKDYGRYANAEGKLPVAFTATNHTTGGNSGSPALDAEGNLIGLNFDRQWEGTMSDLNFDPQYCRNIMVSAKYILFIIDKFAGAQRIIDEITIVE